MEAKRQGGIAAHENSSLPSATANRTFVNRVLRRLVRPLTRLSKKWNLTFLNRFIRYNAVRRWMTYQEYLNGFQVCGDRLVIPELHIPILLKCNLKCEFCAALSPYTDVVFETKDLLSSFDAWSKKVIPRLITIVGGEPLLHPDYEEVSLAIRHCWPDAEIALVTNGVLLNNVSDDFLIKCRDSRIRLSISKHLDTKNYNTLLEKNLERFDKLNVEYSTYPSHQFWIAQYLIDREGFPLPYSSKPPISWNQCDGKLYPALLGNHIFRCCNLAHAFGVMKDRKVPHQWQGVLSHHGVSPDNSIETIMAYLKEGVMAECRHCPEKQTLVESRQIPGRELVLIKEKITDSYRSAG